MIKIDSIKIANFRSFKNQGNNLNNLSRINVMVGKNNVGKTNVLRALYLFFNPETYDAPVDRNMIKQITGGGTTEPKISIKLTDEEIIKDKRVSYTLTCDLNNDEKNYYSCSSRDEGVNSRLLNSSAISKYLEKKFKCVYLSTTDEDIDKQSESLINELILKYYKKQNKDVRDSVENFQTQYNKLINTFQNNISGIEKDLSEQFVGMTDSGVEPVLRINPTQDITKFLLQNVKLQLDDSYAQDISSKGAGIQRASVIMLTIYLMCQICTKENKIILLDEPEAFLYPLLEEKIKNKLEQTVIDNPNIQMFLTSHSRGYLNEVNNPNYSFSYLIQKKETNDYKRSKNAFDINKYTIIESWNRKNKYEVLKNYGLLDQIDDYEYVIVCEGETDKNYICKILNEKEDIPQIRFNKYSFKSEKKADLDYDFIGNGATASLQILLYLEKISNIHRTVLVLLDGDDEGKKVEKKIKPNEFHNLDLHVYRIPDNKQIEDLVFSKEQFIDSVLKVCPAMKKHSKQFKKVITDMDPQKSLITQTEQFIDGLALKDVNIYEIKNKISQNLDDIDINKEWLLNEVDPIFYSD